MNRYTREKNDDQKQQILEFLNGQCFRGRYWQTKASVARACGLTFDRSTKLVNELIRDGFLALRDSDIQTADFMLSLKPELRQKR